MKKYGAAILGTGLLGLSSILNFLGGVGIIGGIIALLVGNSARGIELLVGGVILFLIKFIAMFLVGGGLVATEACKKNGDVFKAAERGDAYAQCAKRHRRLDAEEGNAKAQYELGSAYASGVGVPQDYKEAVNWYRRAAEQGNVDAQFELGMMYLTGTGVSPDYEEAVKWYRLAAEQGDAYAQTRLGRCYVLGEGVPQDYKEAVKWYRLAAEQGDAEAEYEMGYASAKGEGVAQDYKEAVKWWRLASEKGYADAQFFLGVAYGAGKGVQQDLVKAYAWYNIAASQGDDQAVESRSGIIKKMTPAQIEEGQKLSREYAGKFIAGG